MWIVISNDAIGPETVRALSSPEALTSFEARGWVALGGCSDPARDPLRTDAEQLAYDKAERERIAALLKSDAAPATSRPRK